MTSAVLEDRFPDIADGPLDVRQQRVKDQILSGPRGRLVGPFRTLLHAPGVEAALHPVGEYLRFGSTLQDDVRELAILATSVYWRCAFEWEAHEPIARAAGLTEEDIGNLRQGLAPAREEPRLKATHDVACAILRTGRVPGTVFGQAVSVLGRESLLELLVLCGYYSTLAMVLNAAREAETGDSFP